MEVNRVMPDTTRNSMPLVTIDSSSTRDIDDGFSLTQTESGWRLCVAIANPLNLVLPGGHVDLAARAQAMTLYRRDSVREAMLPPAISQDGASLIEGRPRDAVLFTIELTRNLDVIGFAISESTVCVDRRLSYEDIPKLASRNDTSDLGRMIGQACALARGLYTQRRRSGALAFFDERRGLLTNEDGTLIAMQNPETVIGHLLVQELMVLTNRLAAEYAVSHGVPVLFRNHERMRASPPASELADLIESWAADGNVDAAERTLSMLSQAAAYGDTVKGHYALSLPVYMHTTSPLRRYADLASLRALVRHVRGEPPLDAQDTRALADSLNETIRGYRDAQQEYFKGRVLKVAAQAVERGTLDRLDDSELAQALKLATDDAVPEPLARELARRLDAETASDKLVFSAFERLRPTQLAGVLLRSMAEWLNRNPQKNVSLLHHLERVGLVADFHVESDQDGQVFTASVAARYRDKAICPVVASGNNKRGAEQRALLSATCHMFGMPIPVDAAEEIEGAAPDADRAIGTDNARGALQTLCQRRHWPQPRYAVTFSGPDNSRRFACVASIPINGQDYVGEGRDATTKKDAERAAARALLAVLEKIPGPVHKQSKSSPAANPVGQLQEAMQRQGAALPRYSFVHGSEHPPVFTCTVRFGAGGALDASGEGSSKHDAKTIAATRALACIAGAANVT